MQGAGLSKKFQTNFWLVLLGMALLYLPVTPLALNLTTSLPDSKRWIVAPETGMLPFLALYWGALVAVAFLYRLPEKFETPQVVKRAIIWAATGALLEILILPVLSRGLEGVLIWINPTLWLVGLVVLAAALPGSALWGLAIAAVRNRIKS